MKMSRDTVQGGYCSYCLDDEETESVTSRVAKGGRSERWG